MQPQIIADFETQLSTAIAIGATSFSISSGLDDDGIAAPTGTYYFTVDNGASNKEYLTGTLTGTSVTVVKSVSRQGVETTGAVRAHRVGASVIMTDFATYKKYIDAAVLAGALVASTTVTGITRVSVAPANAAIPIAVGDNDTRVPTAGEKTALTSLTTYLTTAPTVQTFTASGTYTKPTGLKWIKVKLQAAGGGSGGTQFSGSNASSGGGAPGGYLERIFAASSIGATEVVTIGAGGIAGIGGGANAGQGGTTSLGALLSRVGGLGSLTSSGVTGINAVTAIPTEGNINVPGTGNSPQPTSTLGGFGGDSFMGIGGVGAANAAGNVGSGFGSGAGGSNDLTGGSTERNGAAGQPGLIVVEEHYI